MNDAEAGKIYDRVLDLAKKWEAVLENKKEWLDDLEDCADSKETFFDHTFEKFFKNEKAVINSFIEPMLPEDREGNAKDDDFNSLVTSFDKFADSRLYTWFHLTHGYDSLPLMSKPDDSEDSPDVENIFFKEIDGPETDYGLETLKAYAAFSKALNSFMDDLLSKKTEDEKADIADAVLSPFQKSVRSDDAVNAVKLASSVSESLTKVLEKGN
jgi:hypothetical protein